VWWGLIITTELGIREWSNAITFIDSGTARINSATVNLFLDNDQAATRWQTTTGRIYRADGARPVLDPPTSGGLDPQWLLPVLTISTGSVLTAGQQTELANASTQATAAATQATTAATEAAEASTQSTTAAAQSTIAATQSTIAAVKSSEIHVRNDLDATKPQTYANDDSFIANDDFTLTKTSIGPTTFTVVKT
jgi:hypothetical protein